MARKCSSTNDNEDDSDYIVSLIFSPNGNRLAAITVYGEVRIWNTPKGKRLVSSISGFKYVESLMFSPDGNILAIKSTGERMQLLSIPDNKSLFALPFETTKPMAFSPNGKIFASASANTGKLWSVPEGAELAAMRGHTGSITSIAFSPAGNLLATASDDHHIKLWGV